MALDLGLLICIGISLMLFGITYRQYRHLRSGLGTLLHDLKTPLAIIQLHTETLLRHDLPPEKQKKILEVISDSGQQFTESLEQLQQSLDGQKRECLVFGNLSNTVREIADRYFEHLKLRGFTVEVQSEDDHLFARFNKPAISQALINLLDNARKYSGPEKWIGLNMRREDGNAIIEVVDRGHGVVPEERKKLFRTFFRGRVPFPTKGEGLGLSIAREVMKRHQGRLECDAAQENGAVFRLRLPVIGESSVSRSR